MIGQAGKNNIKYRILFQFMPLPWKNSFTEGKICWQDEWRLASPPVISSLQELKHFLDLTHIRYGLLKPYAENPGYPLIDSRDLLPSFESDLLEYKNLPGFSMVALDRPLNYFSEIFQFDMMRFLEHDMTEAKSSSVMVHNLSLLQSRIHKAHHQSLSEKFADKDITSLEHYPALLPYMFTMDRAQVFALNKDHTGKMKHHLQGFYASFPSDLDTEIKRYGLRIGKFAVGDNELYEKNRTFVYQYLMELYGFPIASERRTSAALFARRLHKMGEKFIIRTLGQSDRTITTVWNDSSVRHYPKVEKTALIAIDADQKDLIRTLDEAGYFIDPQKRVAIIRVTYRQHKFAPDNMRQERALSVEQQEVIHPVTGEALVGVNIIKDVRNMFLHLNDIVRGEYTGRIVYKRSEIVENTDTNEKRLKFLYTWLTKHQRRMIGYSDDFFANMAKLLDNYLLSPENYADFAEHNELYREVSARYSYIRQARRIRMIEDLQRRVYKGKRIGYGQMMAEVVTQMQDIRLEIINYFETLVASVIKLGEKILNDAYLQRKYIEANKDALSPAGLEIRKNYGKLVALVDSFKAVRKLKTESPVR